jgi:hypothetical protein
MVFFFVLVVFRCSLFRGTGLGSDKRGVRWPMESHATGSLAEYYKVSYNQRDDEEGPQMGSWR